MKLLESDSYICRSNSSSALQDLKVTVTEKIFFLRQFAKHPKRVGSITPSSDFLARTMIEPVQWDSIQTIVELGAGTGVLTRYIEELRHPGSNAIVFELDYKMQQRLAALYPDMHYRSNATDLSTALQEMGLTEIDCILSGLPFANFEQQLRNSILEEVLSSLKSGGLFVTFQYSLQMKNQLQERFSHVHIKFAPFNIPPAFVYYCYK